MLAPRQIHCFKKDAIYRPTAANYHWFNSYLHIFDVQIFPMVNQKNPSLYLILSSSINGLAPFTSAVYCQCQQSMLMMLGNHTQHKLTEKMQIAPNYKLFIVQ